VVLLPLPRTHLYEQRRYSHEHELVLHTVNANLEFA
jgi:hypothetical protein